MGHLVNWKIRYWSIFLGQSLSQVGSSVTQFIIMLWLTTTFKSVDVLATAGVFALLPEAILAPIGGVVADRFSRRLVMIWTDLISAICILAMIYLFSSQKIVLWNIYALLAIRSSMQAFQGPSSHSITSMIVPKHFIPRAAGFSQSVDGIRSIAGAPIGAFALAIFPIQHALMIDVVTAILGIVPLLFFKIPQIKMEKESRLGVLKELREGFDLVWNSVALRRLFLLEGMTIAIMAPCMFVLPLLVTTHFNGDARAIAILEGVSGGAIILGGIAVSFINPQRKILAYLIFLSVSCFAVGLVGLVPSSFFWGAVLLWSVSGFTYSFGDASFIAILQSSVPNQIQGRVFSLLAAMMGFAAPLGLSIVGPVGNAIGPRSILLIGGCSAGIIFTLSLILFLRGTYDTREEEYLHS